MSFLLGFNHNSYIISAKHLNISHASYVRLITVSWKHWKTKYFLCSKGNIFCEIWNLETMFFKLKEGNDQLSEEIFPINTSQEVRQQSIYIDLYIYILFHFSKEIILLWNCKVGNRKLISWLINLRLEYVNWNNISNKSCVFLNIFRLLTELHSSWYILWCFLQIFYFIEDKALFKKKNFNFSKQILLNNTYPASKSTC